MTASKRSRPVDPIALTRTEAARSVGMSVVSFDRYVMPDLKVIRRGTILLVPVAELRRWVERNASLTL